MKLVDRFVCRREGHKPSLIITDGGTIVSAMCTCLRCGKWIEAGRSPLAAARPP